MPRRWGSIQTRQNRDGTESIRIRYEVVHPNGTVAHRSETITSKPGDPPPTIDDAEHRLREIRRELREGSHIGTSKETLKQFLVRWLEATEDQREESSNSNYQHTIEGRIGPYLGDIKLVRLSPPDVLAWIAKLRAEGYKDTTIRHGLSVLGAAMADAVRWRLIPRSPCNRESIKVRLDDKPDIFVWSMPEIDRFIRTARRHENGNLFLFMLETGMRSGEVRALTWSAVDLEEGVVLVDHTIAYDRSGRQHIRKGTKSHRPRHILLRPEMITILRKTQQLQQKRFRADGLTWTNRALLFDRGNGDFISNTKIVAMLRELCALAGVREVTPHTLRHCSATLMLASGVGDRIAQERLGHSTNAMTRRYQHPSIEMQKIAIDRLSEVFERPETTDS